MIRPNFCTTVMPDEYDYISQVEEAVKAANKYHKHMHKECPPPYYPFDIGKLYGLAVTVDKQSETIATLTALLREAGEALEPFSKSFPHVERRLKGEDEAIYYAINSGGLEDAEARLIDFRRAADIQKRIQEVVGV